ncbi:MAG: cytochrome c oxidase assembly protein [Gaiellaceae bacterium]
MSLLGTGHLHLGEFLPPLLACGLYLVLYLQRARTLARRGTPVDRTRRIAFISGALLAALVQLPPIDGLADTLLIAHMLQHIVIGDLASLLLVLGLTGPMLAPLLRIRLTRPLRRLASPLVALVLWSFDLYLWHVPLLYQWAIRHDLAHALEHACLLWFGSLLWLALLGPLPKPRWFSTWARLGYVVLVRFAGAVLANVLLWAQAVFYPVYRSGDAARGLDPLSDQNVAGAIMMLEQMLLTFGLLVWLFLRAARQDEERQALLEFAAEHELTLSEQRAALAADAGTTDRLRTRLIEDAATAGAAAESRDGKPA